MSEHDDESGKDTTDEGGVKGRGSWSGGGGEVVSGESGRGGRFCGSGGGVVGGVGVAEVPTRGQLQKARTEPPKM